MSRASLVFGVAATLSLALLLLAFSPAFHAGLFFIDDALFLSAVPPGGLNLQNLWSVFWLQGHPVYVPITDLSYLGDQLIASTFGISDLLMLRRAMSVVYLSLTSGVLALIYLKCRDHVLPAVLLALLFALHPLHAIPTVWIASRKDVLVTLFSFLTVLAYWKGHRRGAFVCFVLALLSKQSAYALPLWIFTHEMIISKAAFRQAFRRVAPFLLVDLLIFSIGMAYSPVHPRPAVFVLPQTFSLIKFYVGKVFLPIPITQYYARPEGFGLFLTAFSLVLLMGIFFGPAIWSWLKKRQLPAASIWILGLCLIFPYVVVVPKALIVNNAYAFPFVGAILLCVFLLCENYLQSRTFQKICLASLVAVFLCFLSYDRALCREFSNPVAAFKRNANLYPDDRIILTRYGYAALDAKDFPKAKNVFQKVIEMRMQEDGRISEDVFRNLRDICLEQKDDGCLNDLGTLAARNSTPFYCIELKNGLRERNLPAKGMLDGCRARFPSM